MASGPPADPSAGKLREESMAQTMDEPPVIREAKALAHYYRNRPLVIEDDELIVGDCPRAALDPAQPARPTISGRRNWHSPWPVPKHVEPFFAEGSSYTVPSRETGNPRTLNFPLDITHPPLHPNCRCAIIPNI